MKLDPIITTIWLALIITLSLITYDLHLVIIILIASIIPPLLLSRKDWMKYMKYSGISAIMILAFNFILLGPDKLDFTLILIFKFLAISSAFALFSMVVDFDTLLDIMALLRMPDKASASIAISMRFFPDIMDMARDIESTLIARGIRYENKGWKEKIKARTPVLSSLLLLSLEKSITIAEALELKGFPKKSKIRNKSTGIIIKKYHHIGLLTALSGLIAVVMSNFWNSILLKGFCCLSLLIITLGVKR